MNDKKNTQASKHVKPSNLDYDVIISGGGLSGCLMALSLADLVDNDGKPLSIAIIEPNKIAQGQSKSFDDRVLALSHGTSRYLNTLGVWAALKKEAEAIEKIHISDRGHYGKARITAEEHQVSALGYVVEMSVLGQVLLEQLSKTNISWLTPDYISDINWQQSHVSVALNSGKSITGALLLGCDGAKSPCRTFANINVSQTAYKQSAIIANVSTAMPHHNVAYERFTENGPIAMLPLSQNRCSLVWTVANDQAEAIKTLDDDAFKSELETAFGSWLGAITKAGKREVYPLNLVQADEQVFHRMALVGNASHTIHPIAGQGFNLGVRDVQLMALLIKQAVALSQDIGHFSLLQQYQHQRQHDHNAVIKLTDSLVTLFSNELPPLVTGRNIALKALNYMPVIKNAFVKKTMGY